MPEVSYSLDPARLRVIDVLLDEDEARTARRARGQDGAGGGTASRGPPLSAAGLWLRCRVIVLLRVLGEPGGPAEAERAGDQAASRAWIASAAPICSLAGTPDRSSPRRSASPGARHRAHRVIQPLISPDGGDGDQRSAFCLAAFRLAGRPPGYRGDRGVRLVQRLRCPGGRIAAPGGYCQAMDECPGQRQGDRQQQPHPQAPGEKCPHAQDPFVVPALPALSWANLVPSRLVPPAAHARGRVSTVPAPGMAS